MKLRLKNIISILLVGILSITIPISSYASSNSLSLEENKNIVVFEKKEHGEYRITNHANVGTNSASNVGDYILAKKLKMKKFYL